MLLDEIFSNDRQAPAHARAAVSGRLSITSAKHLIDDAQLLATELVTNAVRYATGPIRICAQIVDGTLRVEVRDSATDSLPAPRDAQPDDEDGRGLALVERLSNRWGWYIEDGTKVVWFDLSL